MQTNSQPQALVVCDTDPSAMILLRIFRQYFSLRVTQGKLSDFQTKNLNGVDLVIACVSRENSNGLTEIKRLQSVVAPVPVLVVGHGGTFEVNEYLRAEIFDYLPADMAPVELAMRIQLMSKKLTRKSDNHKISLSARVMIDTKFQQVLVDGKSIFLSPIEYKILLALSEFRGQEMSREQIVDKVWGKGFAMNSRSVDSHISRLRSKVEPVGVMVDVKRGAGYFLRIP